MQTGQNVAIQRLTLRFVILLKKYEYGRRSTR